MLVELLRRPLLSCDDAWESSYESVVTNVDAGTIISLYTLLITEDSLNRRAIVVCLSKAGWYLPPFHWLSSFTQKPFSITPICMHAHYCANYMRSRILVL